MEKIKAAATDNATTSLTSLTLRGISWSGGSRFARLGLRLIISAILARLLLPEDFGLVGMVFVFAGVIGMFSELGLGAAVIQRQDVTEEHLSSVFWANVITGLALTLLMIGLAPGIAYFYGEERLIPITMALGTRFFISSFGIVHRTLLTKYLELKKIAVIEVVAMGLAGGIAILLAFQGMGVWTLVIHSIILSTITVLLFWGWSEWRPRLLFRWSRMRELFGFSFNLLGFRFVNYFNRNLDNLLIGKFLGSSALGYYDRAYQLMLFPLENISGVLSRVLFPAFSAIQDDLPKLRQVYLRATRYISVVTFPMMLGLFVVAPEFIRVVFGSRWEPSILLLQVLCLIGLEQSISNTVGWIYLSQGRTDVMFKWGLLSVGIVATSFFIGIQWSVEGVAIAYAIASILLTFPGFYIPFRLINLSTGIFFRNFTLTFATSLGMAIIVFGCRFYLKNSLQANDAVILFSCAGVGIISYISLMAIFDRKLMKELFSLLLQTKSHTKAVCAERNK